MSFRSSGWNQGVTFVAQRSITSGRQDASYPKTVRWARARESFVCCVRCKSEGRRRESRRNAVHTACALRPTKARRLQSVEVNEPSTSGDGQYSRAILDAELGEEMAHVDLHRLLADSERRRDFFVSHAFRYQFD